MYLQAARNQEAVYFASAAQWKLSKEFLQDMSD